MKNKLLLLVAMVIVATGLVFAQSADNEDEVIKIDKWNQQAYREGEILVKFKAEGAVQMRAPRKAKFQTAQVNVVDALFAEIGVDSVEQLMPQTGHKNVGRRVRAYNGSEVEVKDLSKLYRLTLNAEKAQNIYEAIDKLKALEEVEFAEPNYVVYTMALPYDADIPTSDRNTYTHEPLYSQQWGLAAINLPELWNKNKKSSKRPVIAIIDTGVDIEHPDLAANIWTNTAEANGIANQDDDANGFKDDLHGWDFINNHSVTNDFNGHGTHCAGIAAAVGNNHIGITGANPDAYIMPVTVMQSNGTGDVATIVKGIDYAAANGADVISMSIGGYSYSLAEEQALGRAYADAVLVASAGNDGHAMVAPNHCLFDAPMFPAAFSFVLGVEASADAIGNLASFSNYDESGPIYSPFGENKLYNYELRAPGVQILSTFPGGRYKVLNGTSMACPLVAGAISRLIQCKETLSWELLFGDLIHTRVVGGLGNVNILAAYNLKDSDRKPELSLVSENLTDTVSGDGDNRADAGETIEFYPILKNAWGQAENIRFWVKTGYYAGNTWVPDDETLIEHLQDTAYFGKPISSYAKATSANPWRLTINPNCADGRKINLTLFAKCDNTQEILTQRFILDVENGVEIGGMISEDMTLYPNVHYIVTRLLAIPSGVTLTIKPGVILKFKDNTSIKCEGKLIAKGTTDSLLLFTKADNCVGILSSTFTFSDTDTLEYVCIKDFSFSGAGSANTWGFNGRYKNCILQNCIGHYPIYNGKYEKCNIFNLQSKTGLHVYGILLDCNIINNAHPNNTLSCEYLWKISNMYNCNSFSNKFKFNNNDYYVSGCVGTSISVYISEKPSYFGSSNENILHRNIVDINHPEINYSYTEVDLNHVLTRPSSEAHGIVWKILVDGIDSQDEFDFLPPIGVGQHKCEVYFNRPMDVSIAPTISFGVRDPYTQHQVAENGSWSADSLIYTAYFTIDAKSVTDGLNTFKVYGAEDNEHFEIPEENYRFHMEVAAAGSMSTGLMAEAGLGKVTLTWETDEEDFADLLGYNIYRWTQDTIKWDRHKENGEWVEAGWKFDTICINSSLIDSEDTQFIDYDVVPGKAYYYVIRQMTTAMNSYDLSNPVTATPLTAIKGDANGSMSVDVADVITEVNYITRQNPQPFIFEAADVNSDDQVNIIDVVATIDIILHPENHTSAINSQQAYYYIENGILYVESDVVLGGVQCNFTAENGHEFVVLDALKGFETVSNWQTENEFLFMAYSMSGKTLEIGKHALLQIGDAELTNIVLSDAQGHNVVASPRASTALDGTLFMPCSTKYIQDNSLYIKIGEHIYNAMGQQVK